MTFDGATNVNAEFDNDNRLVSPENELAEYFIQFRYDDIEIIPQTMKFNLKIDENEIITQILMANKESFRNILRDAVTKATIFVNHGLDNPLIVSRQNRLLRNKIMIVIEAEPDVELRDLTSADHEGEIVTFKGYVSNWGKAKTITHRAEYKCDVCGEIFERDFKPKLKEFHEDCKAPFVFFKPILTEDTRRITLREIIDDFSGRNLPISVTADVYGKTVSEVQLSDKLEVMGLFRSIPLVKSDGKLTQEFIPTIQIIGTRNIGNDTAEMPDMELIKKIKDLEEAGKLVEAVIDGYAYNVYKKRMEKKAVICSLIGSDWIGPVGSGSAPMIHILFAGDPETFKSTIMKYMVKVSDNCIVADATTVSNAGIKAIAVKMEDGQWSIRAGLLPLYNGGNVFFDEFGDFRDKSIYEDLKNPMIDGIVTKHVAGEDFSGIAETGVLASMNPVDGVWNANNTIYDNLASIPIPLLTRFDLIVKFGFESPDYDVEAIDKHHTRTDEHGKPTQYLTDTEIRLFINFVKTIHPKVTKDALERRNQHFQEIKEASKDKKDVGTRTKNAIMKFAVALARWHMSDVVSAQHVEEAIKIHTHAGKTFNMNFESGEILDERTLKKTSDGRREAVRLGYEAVQDESGYAFKEEIFDKAMEFGVFTNRGQIDKIWGNLYVEGKLSEKNKMFKITWQ
jgi:DNA replicative helicase MCM subunit Mcm2 (Cdc46/Mcm family)